MRQKHSVLSYCRAAWPVYMDALRAAARFQIIFIEIPMQPSFARNAIVLGLLSAIGPFAIDMYLPALPTIAADLEASVAATQMSLMAFFAAFGLFQVVYGPVSDIVGRKAPIYFGLVLFVAGSVGCALAPTIELLIALRVVQGSALAPAWLFPGRSYATSTPASRRRA
jgi:MFS family permease